MSEYIVTCDDEVAVWVGNDVESMRPLVRCRDCKYAHEVTWPVTWRTPEGYLDCTGELVEKWDYLRDEPKNNPVPPDGFCAWGERRGDAE